MKILSCLDKGFTFSCSQCGKCCSADTDGSIFVYYPDLDRLSKYFHLTLEDFAEIHLDLLDYEFKIWTPELEYSGITRIMPTLVFNVGQKHDCSFLTTKNGKKLCGIYEARPFQCRSFPFWSQIMTSESFLKESMAICQGIKILETDFSNSENFPQSTVNCSSDLIQKYVLEERKLEYDYYSEMKKCNFDIYAVYPFLKKKKEENCRVHVEENVKC